MTRNFAPETLRGDRTDIKAIAKWLGIRDVDSLFKGVVIPTTAQLHDVGIAYNEKNRRHLGRDEVQDFVGALVALTSGKTKPASDANVLSLLFGSRPQEAPCAQILEHAIYIDGTYKNGRKKSLKTASKGVREISVKRTAVIDAILLLTECNPKPFPEKSGLSFFRAVAAKAGIHDADTIDRYCLRHTALTWLTRTQAPQREICDMAGHMSLRMLDDHYCFRKVKDQRSWVDAMPLNLDGVPEDWHGFLLECFIVAIWPEIQNGIKPKHDPKFQALLQILSKAKNVRKKTSLFD